MNKNLFRIIFSKKTGQFIAVSENTKNQGKANQQGNTPTPQAATENSINVGLRTGIMATLLAILLPNATATQIVIDGNAPSNQRPTIMQGPNGTPLVNIQTPSPAGISRNAYTQFDISDKGVLLNNDRQSNPWLATGSARVILNEINSANPSNLHGAITINGQRAELIIANPAGLNINGATVNNAATVMLTAGRAEFTGDQLNIFHTGQGQILLHGQGLNTGDAQYTTLLSRAMNVQATMRAQQLGVIAGNVNYNYDSGELTAQNDSAGKPAIAVDISQLGGMYAGKIQLLVTEEGAGVRNAGKLDAGNGTLIISADGKLENSGALNAAYLSANSLKADIDNKGTLNGQQLLALSAGGNILLSGNQAANSDNNITLQASKNIELSAGAVIGKQTGTGKAVAYAGQDIKLGSGAMMQSGQSVELQATGGIQAQTATIATTEGNVTLMAERDITMTGSLAQGKNLHIETGRPFTETTAPITLQNTQLDASGQTTVIASGDLNLQHQNASISTGAANVYLAAGRHLTTQAGTQLHGSGKMTLLAKENLTLQGNPNSHVSVQANGQLDIIGGTVTLQGGQVNNTASAATTTLAASKELTLQAQAASAPVKLDSKGALFLNSHGNLTLDGVQTSATESAVVALGQLNLHSQAAHSQLTSSGSLRLHGQQGLAAHGQTARSVLRADGSLALTSAGELGVHNVSLNSGDVLSLSSKARQHLSGSELNGGALVVKTAEGDLQLNNSQLKTHATRSAELAPYSGNLSIETGASLLTDSDSTINASQGLALDIGQGDLVLTPDHKLTAGNGFNLRARNGDIRLEGVAGGDGLPATRLASLHTSGDVTLTGNRLTLNGVSIRTNGNINLFGTNGNVVIDGIKSNYASDRLSEHAHEINKKIALINQKKTDAQNVLDKNPQYIELKNRRTELESFHENLINSGLDYAIPDLFDARMQYYNENIAKVNGSMAVLENPIHAINAEKSNAEKFLTFIDRAGKVNKHTTSSLQGNNINLTAASAVDITGANITAEGQLNIRALGTASPKEAGGSNTAISISGVIDSAEYGVSGSDDFAWATLNMPSRLSGKQGITLQADGAGADSRIHINGSELHAAHAPVRLSAAGDIKLSSSKNEIYSYHYHSYKTGSWYNRKTVHETRVNHQADPAVTALTGKGISLASGGSIDAYATQFNAPQGSISLVAANSLGLWAVESQNHSKFDQHVTKKFIGIKYDKDRTSSSSNQASDLPVHIIGERVSTASGWDTRLQGTIFETSLAGADIRAGVGPNARPDAQIILEGIKNTLTTSFTRESNSVVWQKQMGQGSTTQTMALPSFSGPALPSFSAPGGIVVQIPEGELKSQVQTLAAQPSMAYLKMLAERNDVNWQPIKLAHDQWQYKQEGLTPAGAAILSIAIAIATGPGGAAAMSGMTSSLSGVYATMANAAINGLASQAAITLVNNKGDIGKTLNAMGRSSTVKSMISSALTAGVLDKIGQIPGMDTLKNGSEFHQKLAFNLVNAGGSAVVNTAIHGGKLEDALKTALTSAFVTTVHGEAASQIKLLEDQQILHKLAHAAAGCAAAAAQSQTCRDGAIGAAVGEIVAEMFKSQQPGAGASKEQLADYDSRVLGYSKLVAGAISAYAGGDAQAAIDTAEIAVQNNYLSRPQLQALQAELNACKQNKCSESQLNAVIDKYAQLSAQNDAALAACTTTACVDQHRKTLAEAAAYSTGTMRDVANSGSTSRRLGELLARENKAVALQHKHQQSLLIEKARKELDQYVQTNCQGITAQACSTKLQNSQATAAAMTEIVAGFTPAGIAVDIKDLLQAKTMGDFSLAVLGTVLPGLGDGFKNVIKKQVDLPLPTACLTPPACFVAGTLIETSNGLQAIETFVGGEHVYSRHEETGAAGYRAVISTKQTHDIELITLTIADASGKQEVLRTTAEHPFRVSNLQTGEGWVKAEALTVDMQLLDRHGKPLHLLKVETTGERATVYNIEVQEHHTYHVGRLGVWVHNANCCDVIGRVPTSPSFKGHISKTKLGNSSLDLDVNANQQLIISDVVANGDKFGYKTEALLHDVLNSTPGVKVLTGTKYSGEKGLDHVVQFTDAETGKLMTMVIDSKQLAKSGGTGLNPKAAGSAESMENLMQLSDASLSIIAGRLKGSPAANAITQAIKNGTLLKAVSYVDKQTGVLKIAPLSVK